MERLILLAGLPGVGKSTIARGIASDEGAIVIDMDDFKRVAVASSLVTSQIDPPEVRWTYYQSALAHAFTLGGTVIMDEVFHLDSLRTRLEQACRARGVQVRWIEVRCSYKVVERRLRAGARVGHILSTDEALRMYQLFQAIFEGFPEGKENYGVVNNDEE
jgi:predicted kinase